MSGATQLSHNDINRAAALEGRGLVFLGRIPTPTAARPGELMPGRGRISFSRRTSPARLGGLGLQPGRMLAWLWSVPLCLGPWALWVLVSVWEVA